MRRASALLPLITLFLVVPAQGASACSCVDLQRNEGFARADVVFTGTVTGQSLSGALMGLPNFSTEWRFDVDAAQKGTVHRRVLVKSARMEASCGMEFVAGKRYQVFADKRAAGVVETGLCDGNIDLTETAAYRPTAAGSVTGGLHPRVYKLLAIGAFAGTLVAWFVTERRRRKRERA